MARQWDNLSVRYDLRLAPGRNPNRHALRRAKRRSATTVAKGAQLAAAEADALVGMSPEEVVQVANFVSRQAANSSGQQAMTSSAQRIDNAI